MEAISTKEIKKAKPKNKGTKVFKNPIIEKLSRTHILVPITIFVGFSAWMVYWVISKGLLGALDVTWVFLVGLLLFTFIEYMVHRHVFHMIPNSSIKEKLQYAFHGVHHDYPKDKTRLAMPPIMSVTVVAALFFLFRTMMGEYVFAFLPGFLIGYSSYLGVHFIVHAFQPPKNFFKTLWINHGIHHYKDDDRAFGVSSPLWDFVFRTLPRK